jgi:antirestriction protein ArdC
LHCQRWSLNNQMVVHLLGHGDAATYKQWQAMGRQVKRGSKAFYLMKPHLVYKTVEDEATGENKRIPAFIKGFGWFPVFGYEHTLPLPDFPGQVYCLEQIAEDRRRFVAGLPLVEVAQAWSIHVTTYRARNGGTLGWAIPGRSIGLGVANLSTWAHELVHQAEHRLGALTLGKGQDRDNEIVAELGGAVLLTLLGHQADADWGGAYEYIRSYSKARDGDGLLAEVLRLTGRMAAAVQHILEAAERTSAVQNV